MTTPNMQEARRILLYRVFIDDDYDEEHREKALCDISDALDKHDKESEARGRLAGLEEGRKNGYLDGLKQGHFDMEMNKRECSSCGKYTEYCCADCSMDLKVKVYICGTAECRIKHEERCPHELQERLAECRSRQRSSNE